MPRFTVRVELDEATYQDYTTLNASMEKAGFSRFITDPAGQVYRLPLAEYDYDGDRAAADVVALARAAAVAAGWRSAILVTEARERAWEGLRPA